MATANVRFTADTTDFQRGVRQINDNVAGIKTAIGALGGALAAIGVTAVASSFARMGSDILKSSSSMAASFETLQVQLEVLTGSAETAGNLVRKMSEYGAKTPFEQGAIQDAVKTLLTFGIATEDVMGVVGEIGDVSMGSADKLASLARVFGQVSSSGVMMGEDVNQLIDAGFNPLIEISRITGESVASLKQKASDGMLGINDLRGAFITATSEGGKYQGMLEKISNTTEGKMSNFKDNIDQLKIALGTGFNVGLNDVLDKLNNLTPEFKSDVESIGSALGNIVSIFATKLPGTLTEFKAMIADKSIWEAGLDIFKKGLVDVLSSPEVKEAFSGLTDVVVPEKIQGGAKMLGLTGEGSATDTAIQTGSAIAGVASMVMGKTIPGSIAKIIAGLGFTTTAVKSSAESGVDISELIFGALGISSMLGGGRKLGQLRKGIATAAANRAGATAATTTATAAPAVAGRLAALGARTLPGLLAALVGFAGGTAIGDAIGREGRGAVTATPYIPSKEVFNEILQEKLDREGVTRTLMPIVSYEEEQKRLGESMRKAMDAAKGLTDTPIDKYLKGVNAEITELAKTFGFMSENVLPATRGTMVDSLQGVLDFAGTLKTKATEGITGFSMEGFRGFQSEMAAVGGASFFTKGQTAENNLRITNQYLAKIERNTKGLIKLEPSWS